MVFGERDIHDWLPCVHAPTGVLLERPGTWQVVVDEEEGDVVIAAPLGDDPDRFVPHITVSRLYGSGGPVDLDEFADDRMAGMVEGLGEFQLIDTEDTTVAGYPARRVLAACRDGHLALTVEEWWAAAGESVLTLSAVAATLEYDGVADVFARIVETVWDTETSGRG